MTWGEGTKAATKTEPAKTGFGKDYYRDLFENNTAQSVPVRMALVGKENCAKSGLAISLARLALKVKSISLMLIIVQRLLLMRFILKMRK